VSEVGWGWVRDVDVRAADERISSGPTKLGLAFEEVDMGQEKGVRIKSISDGSAFRTVLQQQGVRVGSSLLSVELAPADSSLPTATSSIVRISCTAMALEQVAELLIRSATSPDDIHTADDPAPLRLRRLTFSVPPSAESAGVQLYPYSRSLKAVELTVAIAGVDTVAAAVAGAGAGAVGSTNVGCLGGSGGSVLGRGWWGGLGKRRSRRWKSRRPLPLPHWPWHEIDDDGDGISTSANASTTGGVPAADNVVALRFVSPPPLFPGGGVMGFVQLQYLQRPPEGEPAARSPSAAAAAAAIYAAAEAGDNATAAAMRTAAAAAMAAMVEAMRAVVRAGGSFGDIQGSSSGSNGISSDAGGLKGRTRIDSSTPFGCTVSTPFGEGRFVRLRQAAQDISVAPLPAAAVAAGEGRVRSAEGGMVVEVQLSTLLTAADRGVAGGAEEGGDEGELAVAYLQDSVVFEVKSRGEAGLGEGSKAQSTDQSTGQSTDSSSSEEEEEEEEEEEYFLFKLDRVDTATHHKEMKQAAAEARTNKQQGGSSSVAVTSKADAAAAARAREARKRARAVAKVRERLLLHKLPMLVSVPNGIRGALYNCAGEVLWWDMFQQVMHR
jgi:hypothetical protein